MELGIADRPDVLVIALPPAFSGASARELGARLASLPDTVRVVVFASSQPDTFSLGMDVQGLIRSGQDPGSAIAALAETLRAIHDCSRATLGIAVGRALGGGVGLLAACDYVLADESATFGLPELLWGLVPAAIWPLLCARIGSSRARCWAMTAFARSAAEAHAAGLVDEIAASQELATSARRAVRQLARVEPGAIALLRAWTREASTFSAEEAMRRGAELSARQLGDARVQQRIRAFFDDDALPWPGAKENPP